MIVGVHESPEVHPWFLCLRGISPIDTEPAPLPGCFLLRMDDLAHSSGRKALHRRSCRTLSDPPSPGRPPDWSCWTETDPGRNLPGARAYSLPTSERKVNKSVSSLNWSSFLHSPPVPHMGSACTGRFYKGDTLKVTNGLRK